MIRFIKSIKGKFNCLFCKRYYIVYKNTKNIIKTYEIGNIKLNQSFGNQKMQRNNVGFKAYCFARKQIRSFRHDRIISICKK
jgi:hypothetical protein